MRLKVSFNKGTKEGEADISHRVMLPLDSTHRSRPRMNRAVTGWEGEEMAEEEEEEK